MIENQSSFAVHINLLICNEFEWKPKFSQNQQNLQQIEYNQFALII